MPNRFTPSLDRLSDAQETELKTWVQASLREGSRLPTYAELECRMPLEAQQSNIVFSVTPGELDFHYIHMGKTVLANTHGDYTGTRLADMPGKGPGSLIWQFVCDIARQRQPSISVVPYVGPSADWSHVSALGMPAADDGVNVTHVILSVDFVAWPFLKETSDVRDKTNSLRKYLFEIYDRAIDKVTDSLRER